MATVNNFKNDVFTSLDPKVSVPLPVEEERDLYRQRFFALKVVLKDLQQQLTQYRTRCAGVDTVALMLKESKQEVVKLTRQNKALETAVANLQNRLSTNGLSSSLNIGETELFVPGASKQTLDNLARENARLRGLLKAAEAQCGKKGTEDVHSWKANAENLEEQNSQLKSQLVEMEGTKMNMVMQYEEVIKKLKDEHENVMDGLTQELNQYKDGKKQSNRHNEETTEVERKSAGCQTEKVEPSKIEEMRKTLQLLCSQCFELDQDLENAHLAVKREEQDDAAEKEASSAEKELLYIEQEKKLQQVVQMNQRWQAYSEQQAVEMRSLQTSLTEMKALAQDNERVRVTLEATEAENQKLKQEIQNMMREVGQRHPQPQFDPSIVEILKQQIQVCTEDFNTERKDREQAVARAKQLQEEVKQLRAENEGLKNQIDNLTKIKNIPQPQQENREGQLWSGPQLSIPQFRARGPQTSGIRVPFSSYTPGSQRASSPSPASIPPSLSYSTGSEGSTSLSPRTSAMYSQNKSSQGNDSGLGTVPRTKRNSTPEYSPRSTSPLAGNLSMPSLNRKNSRTRDEGELQRLVCPRCGKEFSDSDLIHHMDHCQE